MYSAYVDAPEQFCRKFCHSIGIVIRKVEAQLGMSVSDGRASGSQRPGSRSGGAASSLSLSTEDQNDLKSVV